jgi:hypothetical protein
MQISLAALNELAMKSIFTSREAVSVIDSQCGARLSVYQDGGPGPHSSSGQYSDQ